MKNCVVETNTQGCITKIFPFEREIEKTEFYSGLLVFYPATEIYIRSKVLNDLRTVKFEDQNLERTFISDAEYKLYKECDFQVEI